VLSVLAQVGDDGTRQFVAARVGDERFRGVRRQMRALVKGEAMKRIDPLAAPARTALDLDLLWAEFLVTGNTALLRWRKSGRRRSIISDAYQITRASSEKASASRAVGGTSVPRS
jgi:hypothetical protein